MTDPEAPLRCPELEEYWRDPRPFEAERAVMQAKLNAEWDARVAPARERQLARWAEEEA